MNQAQRRSVPSTAIVAVERDRYVDALRAGSLFVVVLWHWVFSVFVWTSHGPSMNNPIGTTHGMWFLTWFLQVMPVFFFVGGFVNSLTWARASDSGVGYASFVGRRLRRLLEPAALVLGVGLALRFVLELVMPDAQWVGKAIIVLLSPLWFLIVYVALVALTPRLHTTTGLHPIQ